MTDDAHTTEPTITFICKMCATPLSMFIEDPPHAEYSCPCCSEPYEIVRYTSENVPFEVRMTTKSEHADPQLGIKNSAHTESKPTFALRRDVIDASKVIESKGLMPHWQLFGSHARGVMYVESIPALICDDHDWAVLVYRNTASWMSHWHCRDCGMSVMGARDVGNRKKTTIGLPDGGVMPDTGVFLSADGSMVPLSMVPLAEAQKTHWKGAFDDFEGIALDSEDTLSNIIEKMKSILDRSIDDEGKNL